MKDINITHEPVLWKISAEHPVPAELSKNGLDYIVLNTINQVVQEGGPKAKMPFVHNIVSHTHGEASANRDLSTSQVGLLSDTSSSVLARSLCVPPMSQEGVNNSHLEALLQQQRLLQMYHQRYDPSMQQQLQSQTQNPLISSMLLNVLMNDMTQSATNHAPQHLQAPWQQHPHQAYTTNDNTNTQSCNTDGLHAPIFAATTTATIIPPNKFEPPSSLQGVASTAKLLGIQQTGNAAGISQPQLSTNNYVDSNQRLLYLMQQANQGQGRTQSSLMNSVLPQNLLREQLQQQQPSILSPYSNTHVTMSQPTYNPSNQQLLYAATTGMANLSQPVQYAQQPYQLSQQGLSVSQLPHYHLTNQTLQQLQQQQLQQSVPVPAFGRWGSSNQLQQQQLLQYNSQGPQQLLDQPHDESSAVETNFI